MWKWGKKMMGVPEVPSETYEFIPLDQERIASTIEDRLDDIIEILLNKGNIHDEELESRLKCRTRSKAS